MKGLFIGLNTIDVQFFVENYPEANEKTKAKNYGMYSGGPATNAAITYAHLGGKPQLISSFGRHLFTELTFDELKNLKVDVTDITPNRKCHPIFASVVTDIVNGNRSVISYHPDNHEYCDITLENLSTSSYDIVLSDGFYIDVASRILKKNDINPPVVLDGGSWKKGLERLLPFIDIAICSADFKPPGISNVEENISYLQYMGIEKIAITRGEKPILIFDGPQKMEIPIDRINAIDTLGAGDVFHGAFCFYYQQKKDFIEALTEASKIACNSCKYYGTREWMNN